MNTKEEKKFTYTDMLKFAHHLMTNLLTTSGDETKVGEISGEDLTRIQKVLNNFLSINTENEVKIGDKTFVFKYPAMLDNPVTNILNDWRKLIEKQKINEDVWTVIPALPQYKFKNLQMVSCPFETADDAHELTITLRYDEAIRQQRISIELPTKAIHKLFGDVVLIGVRLECESNNNKMYLVKVNDEYFWVYDYETELVGN